MENGRGQGARAFFNFDRARAWETFSEVVRASNSAEGVTGEDGQITVSLRHKDNVSVMSNNVPDFNLSSVFNLLAREDLQRAIELARSFNHESPRAAATLAIARAVLEEKRRETTRQ